MRSTLPHTLLVAAVATLMTGVPGAAYVAAQSPAPADSVWQDRGVAVRMHRGMDRRIEWEIYLPAPVEDVWRAWTVPDEMTTWASPGAEVDLRPGGVWEVHFEPDRPKGQRGSDANTIVSVVPPFELHLKAGAPPDFPTVREEKTDFLVRLEPAGFGHTRLVAIQFGWQNGPEWDRAFAYLADANSEWLNWLHQRFVRGPLTWPTEGP